MLPSRTSECGHIHLRLCKGFPRYPWVQSSRGNQFRASWLSWVLSPKLICWRMVGRLPFLPTLPTKPPFHFPVEDAPLTPPASHRRHCLECRKLQLMEWMEDSMGMGPWICGKSSCFSLSAYWFMLSQGEWYILFWSMLGYSERRYIAQWDVLATFL